MTHTITATFVITCACAACPEAYEEEGSPSEEACEHAQDGPASATTAGVEADTSAGDVSQDHTRHDVALVAVAGGNGGFVQLDSGGDPLTVFLDVDVPLAFLAADGATIAATRTAETTCDEIVVSYEAAVVPVGKLFLSLGPTEATEVAIVVEAREGAPEDDE